MLYITFEMYHRGLLLHSSGMSASCMLSIRIQCIVWTLPKWREEGEGEGEGRGLVSVVSCGSMHIYT